MNDVRNWSTSDVIKACRFCWMCRHVCTVASVTARESDTPRGKMLSLFGKLMEMDIPDSEIADLVYNCALCYRCRENCVGGFDVPEVVLNTRAEMVAEGLFPEGVAELSDLLRGGGDVLRHRQQVTLGDIEDEIGPLPERSHVFLFGGSRTPAAAVVGAAKTLKAACVGFTVLDEEFSSGYELYEMGFATDAIKVARNSAVALSRGCNDTQCLPTIVTLDPSDNWALSYLWKKWGVDLRANVVDFSSYGWRLVEAGRIRFRSADIQVTYHDPCHLGRLQRVFVQPRRLLTAIEGLTLKEMRWNTEDAHCCGGHLHLYNPRVADQIAAERVRQMMETGVDVVVTACPTCCDSFSRVHKDIRAYHMAEFIASYVA